jgi:hypothetical protein
LRYKLSEKEREKLLKLLEETLVSKDKVKKRELGKYEDKIIISENFNEPMPDFVS